MSQGEQPREAQGIGIRATGWAAQGDRHRGQGNQNKGVGQWVQMQRKGSHTRHQGEQHQTLLDMRSEGSQLRVGRHTGKERVHHSETVESQGQKTTQMVPARWLPAPATQGMNRVRRDYIPPGELKIRKPVVEMIVPGTEGPSGLGKKKNSEASREHQRELHRSGSGISEYESDVSEGEEKRTLSTSPTHR